MALNTLDLRIFFNLNTVLISVLSALLYSSPALSEEWETIIQTPAYTIAVDIDSYNQHGMFASIVARYRYTQDQTLTGLNPIRFKQKTTLADYDCTKQRILVRRTSYEHTKTSQSKPTVTGQERAFRPFDEVQKEGDIASLVCQVQKMVGGQ